MLNERTSRFFDSYAEDFSAIYGNDHTVVNRVVNEVFRKSMKLRFLRTLEGCEPIAGKTVIDIGCGPGHYGVALAQRGAALVRGVDFAQGMIDLAKRNASEAGVATRCTFEMADFMDIPTSTRFDYAVVMGFMDYMANPRQVIDKVLSLTDRRAFFSFPVAGGMLGWQRRMRYRGRCDLYLYTEDHIRHLFAGLPIKRLEIEKIARDFFVTAHVAD